MKTRDTQGRRFPNRLEPLGKTLREPNRARLDLLEKLQWFGALPSAHARAILNAGGMVSPRNQKQTLLDMASEEYEGSTLLVRPSWQYPPKGMAWPSRHHHIIQDIGNAGIKLLKDKSRYVERKNDAHFYHWLMQSCTLSEFYIGASENRDYTFIPQHRLTQKPLEFDLTIEGKKTVLKPDAYFAVDYGGKKRNFFLEVDRGNEQKEGVVAGKKTLERSLRQYYEFIRSRTNELSLFCQTLDDRSPVFALFIFTNPEVMKTAQRILTEKVTKGKGCNFILFRCDPRFAGKQYQAPQVSLDNWTSAWWRSERPDILINK